MRSRYSWLLLLIAVLPFQNCVLENAFKTAAASGQESLASEKQPVMGGGDGYDGKLFYNFAESDLCPDGNQARSIIKIRADGQAEALRMNCQERANEILDPSSYSYMPHNTENLIFGAKAFDIDVKISKDPRLTTYLCRGSETAEYYRIFHGIEIPNFKDRWGDIVIKPAKSGVGHTARFKFAHYEPGSTTQMSGKPLDTGDFNVNFDQTSLPMIVSGRVPNSDLEMSIALARTTTGTLIGKWLVMPPEGSTSILSFNLNIECVPQE